MPNVITHGLMAQDVVQELEPTPVTQAIQDFPQAYLFGSNGPDYLFYYYVPHFLKDSQFYEKIVALGNRIHREHINDFYEKAIEWLNRLRDQDQSIFLSYLAGHLTHWSLDSLAHPYVFHKTGLIEGDTKYHHVRFESMLDTMMIKVVKKGKLSDYPSYKFVKLSEKEKVVIAKGYQFIIKEVFGEDVKLKQLVTAINNMYLALHFFMDSSSIKKKLVHSVESMFQMAPWVVSKHIVYNELDVSHDILNLQHNEWNHPSHPDWVSTASFVEIYQEAIKRGVESLSKLHDDLANHSHSLVRFIDNRTYDTGTNDGIEMTSFNVIY